MLIDNQGDAFQAPQSPFRTGVATAYQSAHENSSRTLGRSVSTITTVASVLVHAVVATLGVVLSTNSLIANSYISEESPFTALGLSFTMVSIAYYPVGMALFVIGIDVVTNSRSVADRADIAVMNFAEGQGVDSFIETSNFIASGMVTANLPRFFDRTGVVANLAHIIYAAIGGFVMGSYLAGGLLGRVQPVRQFMGCLGAVKFVANYCLQGIARGVRQHFARRIGDDPVAHNVAVSISLALTAAVLYAGYQYCQPS